ncbi:MAG: hypothetical protein DA330_08675 [Nitrososphaera sp.]|nr:hypothetical protein [Nitrososphaera sp.]
MQTSLTVPLNVLLASISAGKCSKLLSGDGIISIDFTVNSIPGILEKISIDARAAKKQSAVFGDAFGVAKNLDEYQYRICMLVPTLSDSDPFKVQLQKYRVAAIAAFVMLGQILKTGGELAKWNFHAKRLLVEASDLYVFATSKKPPQIPKSQAEEAFSFMGLSEAAVEKSIKTLYLQ